MNSCSEQAPRAGQKLDYVGWLFPVFQTIQTKNKQYEKQCNNLSVIFVNYFHAGVMSDIINHCNNNRLQHSRCQTTPLLAPKIKRWPLLSSTGRLRAFTATAGAHKGSITDLMPHSHLGTESVLIVRRRMKAETDVPLEDCWTELW